MNKKSLKDIGIDDNDHIKQILELHGEGIEAAKEKATSAAETKAEKEAEKREKGLQKQLEELQKKVDTMPDDGADWKKKYEELKISSNEAISKKDDEVKKLKDGYEAEKTAAKTDSAIEAALVAAGANPKYVKKMAKDVDKSAIELDGDKIKDVEKHIEAVKGAGWTDMFGTVRVNGVDVGKPPANADNPYAGKTATELMAEANKNPENIDAILKEISTLDKQRKE